MTPDGAMKKNSLQKGNAFLLAWTAPYIVGEWLNSFKNQLEL